MLWSSSSIFISVKCCTYLHTLFYIYCEFIKRKCLKETIKRNIKRNEQFVQKVTFQPLMDFKQTIIEVGNITKAATFKSFDPLNYKNTQLLFS